MAVSLVRNTVSVPVAASGSTAASGNGEGTQGTSSFADVLALLQTRTIEAPPGSTVAATEDAAPEIAPEDVTAGNADDDAKAVDAALDCALAALQQIPPLFAPAPAAPVAENVGALDAAASVTAAGMEALETGAKPAADAVALALANGTAMGMETSEPSVQAMPVPVETAPGMTAMPDIVDVNVPLVNAAITMGETPEAFSPVALMETAPAVSASEPVAVTLAQPSTEASVPAMPEDIPASATGTTPTSHSVTHAVPAPPMTAQVVPVPETTPAEQPLTQATPEAAPQAAPTPASTPEAAQVPVNVPEAVQAPVSAPQSAQTPVSAPQAVPQPVNQEMASATPERTEAVPLPNANNVLPVPEKTAAMESVASSVAEIPQGNDAPDTSTETAPLNTATVESGKIAAPQTAADETPATVRSAVPVAKTDAPRVAAMLPREPRASVKTVAVNAVAETVAETGTEPVSELAVVEPAPVSSESESDNAGLAGRFSFTRRMAPVQPQPLERALAQAVAALDANDAGANQDTVALVTAQAVTSAETGDETAAPAQEPAAKPLSGGDAAVAPRVETSSVPAFAAPKPGALDTAKTNAPERPSEPATLKTLVVHTAQNIRYLVSEGGQTITVHLEPETLGQLKIAVHTSGNDVSVTLTAATAAVRDTLEARMPQLREALAKDGLSTGKIDISTEIGQPMTSAGNGQSSQWAAQQQQGHARSMSWNLPRNPFRDTVPVFTPPRRGSVHDGALNLFA